MLLFSAAEAPPFTQALLLFHQGELVDSEVVQLHRGCAIGRGGQGNSMGVSWDLRGSVERPSNRGNGRGRSQWSHQDRGPWDRRRGGFDSRGLRIEFEGSFPELDIQFGGQSLELFECRIVPGGQLILDSTLQAPVEGLSKGHVIQVRVLGIDREVRDVVGNCGRLLQVFQSG